MSEDLEKWAKRYNQFIRENEDSATYSTISNKRVDQSYAGVTPYYPVPRAKEYNKGFFRRHFIIRYDGGIVEISNIEASRRQSSLPIDLYSYVSIKWRLVDSIEVPKELFKDNPTTADVNEFYIREGGKSLSAKLHKAFREYFYDLEAFKLSS
jgi:hypothetical protein